MTTTGWGVPPVQLGERRVLHPGRRRWLRALGWLALLFFLTAGAFGLPLQWAVDHLPAGNAPLQPVSTARAGAPGWLTGGAFGPEGSVVALALVAAVTVVALLRVPRRGAQSERFSNTSSVAVDRFMVMKWMPGAPSSSIR